MKQKMLNRVYISMFEDEYLGFCDQFLSLFYYKKTVDIGLILVYNMRIRYWCVITLIKEIWKVNV